MKNITYLTLLLPLLILSCESTPEALFYSDTIEPVVGQEVFFTNDSQNARSYEWDFGDGYISYDENPVHAFSGTGTFEVTLIAISRTGLEDVATLTLEVMIPTLLEIEVREWFNDYSVGNASVYLFSSLADWDNAVDEIYQGLTDEYGLVVFSNLDLLEYYVDVWEQDHDNYTLRDEDIDFIHIPIIYPNFINRFTAWVDVADHGKGVEKGARKLVIKKLERKPDDKNQHGVESGGTENWQEVYNRRSNK